MRTVSRTKRHKIVTNGAKSHIVRNLQIVGKISAELIYHNIKTRTITDSDRVETCFDTIGAFAFEIDACVTIMGYVCR